MLFGTSFNTVLGASGWALQGEYSFRPDAPLQRAERVVIEEGLRPIITGLGLASCAADPSQEACRHPVTGQILPAQYFHDQLRRARFEPHTVGKSKATSNSMSARSRLPPRGCSDR